MADATQSQNDALVTVRAKRCARCKEIKPVSAFHRRAGRPNGLQSACIECKKVWRQAHASQEAAARKEYYEANREHFLAQNALWLAANKERKSQTNKEWRKANAERLQAVRRSKVAERRTYDAAYHIANATARAAKCAKWRSKNKEMVYAKNRARRAALRGSSGQHTAADIAHLMKVQKNKCAHSWCRANLADGRHVDHVMPLALGGSNDRTNLQLLCPPCNLRKNAKHPIDFAQENGLLL